MDEAYRTLVQVGRYPIAVLDLRVPPGDVDVNVHPRKSEVRLLHERAAFGAIQRAIRRTLAGFSGPPGDRACSARTSAPRRQARPTSWTTGLRVLGQAGGTYIIAEGTAGVYLVDQHAAHERVLFERIHAAWDGRQERQLLLEPAVLDLPPRIAAVARDHLDALDAAGFEVEPFGEGALLDAGGPGRPGRARPARRAGTGARRAGRRGAAGRLARAAGDPVRLPLGDAGRRPPDGGGDGRRCSTSLARPICARRARTAARRRSCSRTTSWRASSDASTDSAVLAGAARFVP